MLKSSSRKGTIRRCGHVWSCNNTGYDHDWYVTLDKRYHVTTWRFGRIHQCKVFIDYQNSKDGKPQDKFLGGSVGICLRPGKNVEEAMQRGLDYVEEYKKNGPPSVEKVFNDKWDHWPTLYTRGNRIQAMSSLFFTIGGGYDWVDGTLLDTSPDDYLESQARRERDKDLEKALTASEQVRKIVRAEKEAKGEELDYWDFTREEIDEMTWSQDVYNFYPASENYSNVCLVPDDVKPEWLQLAYEAALLLRDKSGVPNLPRSRLFKENSEDDIRRQEDNRALGAKVVADLEKRFPQCLKK